MQQLNDNVIVSFQTDDHAVGKLLHLLMQVLEGFRIHITMFTALCWMCSETICTKWYDSSWTENFTTTTEHSKPSLSTLYALDHKRLLKIRSANIEKWRKYYQWKQDYNEEGIDRRQNLSLEEFSDIYDGKW